MSEDAHNRVKNTAAWLHDHRNVLDRETKDGTGGRARWGRKPLWYPGSKGGMLPWSSVKGRYFHWS